MVHLTVPETRDLTIKESARLDTTDDGSLVLTKMKLSSCMGSANRMSWFSAMVTGRR